MSLSDEFVYITMAEISGLFDIASQLYYFSDGQFYYTILNQIILLGKEKGFVVKTNLKPENYDNDKRNKIDVIWRTTDNIIAAFNVDSFFNVNSIGSLASFNSFFKFWIYYGKQEIPNGKEIINDHKIHVIRKNR